MVGRYSRGIGAACLACVCILYVVDTFVPHALVGFYFIWLFVPELYSSVYPSLISVSCWKRLGAFSKVIQLPPLLAPMLTPVGTDVFSGPDAHRF